MNYQEQYDFLKKRQTKGYRFLARDEDGGLWAYEHRPTKDGNYWSMGEFLGSTLFPGITWADDSPTRIDILLDEIGHALLKDEHLGMPEAVKDDFDIVSKPEHYNRGRIDLFESWYLTRPFNEVRAILESIAERYMKRMKDNRIQDLEKAIETLERLKELEVRHEQEEVKATD